MNRKALLVVGVSCVAAVIAFGALQAEASSRRIATSTGMSPVIPADAASVVNAPCQPVADSRGNSPGCIRPIEAPVSIADGIEGARVYDDAGVVTGYFIPGTLGYVAMNETTDPARLMALAVCFQRLGEFWQNVSKGSEAHPSLSSECLDRVEAHGYVYASVIRELIGENASGDQIYKEFHQG